MSLWLANGLKCMEAYGQVIYQRQHRRKYWTYFKLIEDMGFKVIFMMKQSKVRLKVARYGERD